MKKRVFIIGPAHSGKSELAIDWLDPNGHAFVFGMASEQVEDLKPRIDALKAMRSKKWESIDGLDDLSQELGSFLARTEQVLIDSLSQWIATRLVTDSQRYSIDQLEPRVEHEIQLLLSVLERWQGENLVLVSSEVSSGISPPQPLGRLYRQITGRINAKVAKFCDQVILVSAGIPVPIKGEAKPPQYAKAGSRVGV